MSFYSLPETLHHEIATIQGRFIWASEGDKQKYHMVWWSEICKPRHQGGLGIMSSKRMNIALLTKWLWRIANGEVIQLLPVLRIGTSIVVGSGTATLFWFDRWAGDSPFATRFPDLFSIAAIAPSPGHEALTTIWAIWLPLKIRIFLWQWIRGRLPSGVEVLKRNGPGDGWCPLCRPEEDTNHIFFTCVSAQFLWSCFRELVGGSWDHNNLPALFAEL
ncbi:uncharacterized protein [Aegilops tauschii subsp. strangulata]|uniref:uncharacterized protein n=1 Tax=Aegilops tauschii subsp. strangulata TaxID=200361 RepID=UPI003CC8A38D